MADIDTASQKRSGRWMGVQTLELFRREIGDLFNPIINEIKEDKADSKGKIEDKAWEMLGTKVHKAWLRKKELEAELAEVEEVLRKYNGGACGYSGNHYGNSYENYSYGSKRNRTDIEDKIWAAEQLMFPELDELEEMKKSAVKEVTFCEAPSEVKTLLKSIEADLARLTKRYKTKRF
jgi:hypothetical protein